MNTVLITSCSTEATEHIGNSLGQCLRTGDIVILTGDLGAGKTAFSRGVAKGLGLNEAWISSPTFTLVEEHVSESLESLSLFHFDVYRLHSADDFLASGLEEYFYKPGICLIEWGSLIQTILPRIAIEVHLTYSMEDDHTRIIKIILPEDRAFKKILQQTIEKEGDIFC